MDNERRIYKIYKHKLLIDVEVDGRIYKAGMKYYGKTKSKYMSNRWCGGNNYLLKNKVGKYNQPRFAQAIIDCGWDNFSHEVLFLNLTKEEADKMEEILIERHQTRDPSKGFNMVGGGTDIKREKSSRWNPNLKGITQKERKAETYRNWWNSNPTAKESNRIRSAKRREEKRDEINEKKRNRIKFLTNAMLNNLVEYKPKSKEHHVRRKGFDECFYSPTEAAWTLRIESLSGDGSNIAHAANSGKKCGGWEWEWC